MKRAVNIILVFLLQGAVVNIAVAWRCAVSSEADTLTRVPHEEVFALFRASGLPEPSQEWGRPYVAHGIGVQFWTLGHAAITEGRDRIASLFLLETGWPMIALRAEWRSLADASEALPPPLRLRGGIEIPLQPRPGQARMPGDHVLPLIPIWPGFAINTIFYGVILWGLWFGARQARRAYRHRRGQCTSCGYPRGESVVCTECGAALPNVNTGRAAVGGSMSERDGPGSSEL